MERQAIIDQAKQFMISMPGVPRGVNISDISWDAFSYKCLPNSVELLCSKNPTAYQNLSQEDHMYIYYVETQVYQAIKEKCAEYRQRTNTPEDEFIQDCTLYLENQIGGTSDEERELKIAKLGVGVLLSYIDHVANLFVNG